MPCPKCHGPLRYEPQYYGWDISECWICVYCSEVKWGKMIRGRGNSIPHNDVVNPEPIFPRLNGQGRFGNYGGKIRRID